MGKVPAGRVSGPTAARPTLRYIDAPDSAGQLGGAADPAIAQAVTTERRLTALRELLGLVGRAEEPAARKALATGLAKRGKPGDRDVTVPASGALPGQPCRAWVHVQSVGEAIWLPLA